MSEHGIMRPNPALLYDLEVSRKLKSQPVIAHDLGAGQLCIKCGPKCPGFQLHFWRKHCTNCRCGKADHNVTSDAAGGADRGFYFVGQLLDRPMRTRKEELEFCYGNALEEDDYESNGPTGEFASSKDPKSKNKFASTGKKVRFDWIPQNVSDRIARMYLNQMPESTVPIAGSEGAQFRQQQLEKQFPVHDIEPDKCHDLPPEELKSMQEYIGHVKKEVAGLGIIHEVNKPKMEYIGYDDDLPPPPPELLQDDPDENPIYINVSPNGGTSSRSYFSNKGTNRRENLHHARPYNIGGDEETRGMPNQLGMRVDSFSSSSSNGSDRPGNNTSLTQNSAKTSSPLSGVKQRFPVNYEERGNLLHQAMKHPTIPSGQKCDNCKNVLKTGEVAITAERAGPVKIWHPRCFKCHECKELLVDLLYYYKSGKIYCARDYAKLTNIPRCAACDELIFATEFTGAEEKVWHLRHFCCWECDKPLAGHKYVPDENGQPHCLYCFQQSYGKVCRTCGEYIAPEEQRLSLPLKSSMVTSSDSKAQPGSANSQNSKAIEKTMAHWHMTPECFHCQVCRKSLLETKMTMKFGLVLCSSTCAARAAEAQSLSKKSIVLESDL